MYEWEKDNQSHIDRVSNEYYPFNIDGSESI